MPAEARFGFVVLLAVATGSVLRVDVPEVNLANIHHRFETASESGLEKRVPLEKTGGCGKRERLCGSCR